MPLGSCIFSFLILINCLNAIELLKENENHTRKYMIIVLNRIFCKYGYKTKYHDHCNPFNANKNLTINVTTTENALMGDDEHNYDTIKFPEFVKLVKNIGLIYKTKPSNRIQKNRRSLPSKQTECLSPSEIFAQFNLPIQNGLTKHDFLAHICPVLIYQLDQDNCKQHIDFSSSTSKLLVLNSNEGPTPKSLQNKNKLTSFVFVSIPLVWLYALTSILVISAIGFLLVLVVSRYISATTPSPSTNKHIHGHTNHTYEQCLTLQSSPTKNKKIGAYNKKRLLSALLSQFTVALAVGSLIGDALLHLLPHALDSHSTTNYSSNNQKWIVWKGFSTVCTIMILYAFEKGAHLFNLLRRRRRNRNSVLTQSGNTNYYSEVKCKTPSNHPYQSELVIPLAATSNQNNKIFRETFNSLKTQNINDNDDKKGKNSTIFTRTNFTVNAITCILGDAFHNLFDGVAIGVSFGANITAGIGTAIAILCHELPHELGDFAYLMQCGVGRKLCLLLNCVSSICSIIGCLIGLSILSSTTLNNNYNNNTFANADENSKSSPHELQSWIFCIISGMFLYIALSNMIPDLKTNKIHDHHTEHSHETLIDHTELHRLHKEGNNINTEEISHKNHKYPSLSNKTKHAKNKKVMKESLIFAVQMGGCFTGVVIMLLIALYEESIEVSFLPFNQKSETDLIKKVW